MNKTIKTVESSRKDGSKLLNTFFKTEGSDHLVIVLPGAGYSCQGPILYYPSKILVDKSYDVMNVNYDYRFSTGSDEEYESTVLVDARNSIVEALKQGSYKHVTVIAKSVGTWAVTLIEEDFWQNLSDLKVVWLTPLWSNEAAFNRMLKFQYPSLHVIGSVDSHYDSRKKGLLVEAGKSVVVIEGADHGLDIPNQIDKTVSNLEEYLQVLKKFVVRPF
jgi:hypothetical protein